ncbi:hypothetical protein APHWI1_1214 [Anaplasma phagocytophilum str. ApWI1]|uniref:Uncharacterized protein n=1 Tax=Anaplasma phagocytophilum str. ApWI1 TaxID=1359155 RepID=A0A0F3PXP7_ANAPH|nr:hypothetical protein [Anaplasma phagocytophilum]KJV85135.1 hypothetical protein APHWI1_1214 [Anaplasma phagocytophilum str. ApWI1]
MVSMSVMQTSCLSIFGPQEVIVYEPPEGAEGKRCVEQCVYERNNCLRGCDKRKQECQLQESREGVVKDIVGIVKDMTKIGSGSRIERRESECFHKRETCYTGCAGDGFCESRCEIEYGCNSSSTSVGFDFKIGDDTSRRNICSSSRCDYLCKSDHATCFVGCGGKIYKETADPK